MIKFADLKVHNVAARATVTDIMLSGKFINGPYNELFSKQWADECNADACILTASGTAALQAVLHCLGSKHDINIIIMPALSFAATAFAAILEGFEIIYVDVDEKGLIRWDQAEELLELYGPRIATIIPVHLYGQYTTIPEYVNYKITCVEDACQAHGVVKFNKQSSYASIACFSFYPSKNLGAIGDAGAAVVNGLPGFAKLVESYCNYGDPPGKKYVHDLQELYGNNLRCDHIQAAYLSVAYADLQENNAKRLQLAQYYQSNGIQSFATANLNSYHLYPILVEDPERFQSLMHDRSIETGNHYPYILPDIVRSKSVGNYSQANHIARHVVTLPIGPHLTEDDVAVVVRTIQETCKLDKGLWHINI